ncbi:50S ribosomal protein L24e [Candidatus Woesearchaeota archaeon]|nr:50S ribosomal protein L24e [Candidatus Woesearchaeota archaeon]
MAKCDFCGKVIPKGTGKIFVNKDGNTNDFCSNRCEKQLFKLRRKPRKVKWTEQHRKAKSKEGE